MNQSTNQMETKTITATDLIQLGFPEGKAFGLALKAIELLANTFTTEEIQNRVTEMIQNPSEFMKDEILGNAAIELQTQLFPDEYDAVLVANPPDYAVFGEEHIEAGARNQMKVAMSLPVAVAGALMPDAHQGYGLPIGGVLATRNSIIPYGVGVDIGCRMALSVYDIPEEHFVSNLSQYKRELIAWTKFGAGAGWVKHQKAQHAVLDRPEFEQTPLLKQLKDKAASQLGTSGGGNHFVEFGIIEFEQPELGVPKGKYLALLSHSGSRGMGATLAGHYTRLAKELCRLPKEAANLAYLSLDSAEGLEYWMAMNLAGDYASACHEVIHQRMAKALGAQVMVSVENHHNFAWKEIWNGEEVIVHRKGATPASEGVLGIIPGSMTAPGFLVRGKGENRSISSASHGAGRQMSRTQAFKEITKADMKQILADCGVTLIGAGLDEAPMAYKDIGKVMAAQTELVDVLATFQPKLVRMADDGSRED